LNSDNALRTVNSVPCEFRDRKWIASSSAGPGSVCIFLLELALRQLGQHLKDENVARYWSPAPQEQCNGNTSRDEK
jgi:hypothetical protein